MTASCAQLLCWLVRGARWCWIFLLLFIHCRVGKCALVYRHGDVVVWVRIVFVVALSHLFCRDGHLPKINSHCFQASTWHIAREGSDYVVTVHTGSVGTCVHIRADWTTSNSLSLFLQRRWFWQRVARVVTLVVLFHLLRPRWTSLRIFPLSGFHVAHHS